jgi:predicted NBD/HSP70 family sugar kinase
MLKVKKSTRNSAYTKQYNRKLIMGKVLRKPMSRADLAREIGLTRAAITIIVDAMISEGLLVEKGTVSNGIGRNPVILDINPECCYALGLNIARGSCSLGIVNIKGEVLTSKDIDIKDAENKEQAMDVLKKEIDIIIAETDFDKDKLLGMGITTPGPLDSETGLIINPPNFKLWYDTPIVTEFKKIFPFEIKLENNASAMALAEKNYGQGRNFSDFILIVVDTGIGAGIITSGGLYKGSNSLGAELGHTSIIHNGKPCGCGNYGCLEVYAAIPAIVEKAQSFDRAITSWAEIVDAAEAGDENFERLVEKEANYLATSIINAVNILGMEAVILSGYIKYKPEMLLEKIRGRVNQMAINRNTYQTEILVSGIKEYEEIVAAASVVFESLI